MKFTHSVFNEAGTNPRLIENKGDETPTVMLYPPSGKAPRARWSHWRIRQASEESGKEVLFLTENGKMVTLTKRGSMEYWANILAMSGAACIAVAFIDGSLYAFGCGLLMSYAGYKLWSVK